MRVMMKVSIPAGPGNQAIKDGSLPRAIMGFVEKMKPEACYFLPQDGLRAGMFFFDLADNSMMPVVTEPFFLGLNASVEVVPAMNLEDLKAGLQKIAQQG